MIKLKVFLFSIILIIYGCKNDNYSKGDIQLKVREFNLSQLHSNGDNLYTIYSPSSIFDQIDQEYTLDKTRINFFDNNKLKYTINSNNALLDNKNKIITLTGEVVIIDITEDNNVINGDNLIWDIKKSEFILEGNVNLNDEFINLKSSKAILDKNTNVIQFFEPVNYRYKVKNKTTDFKISSQSAFYNIEKKTMIFKSDSDRVRSNLIF